MSVIFNPILDPVASLDLKMRINSEDNSCNGCCGITDEHIISHLSGHQVENNIFFGLVVIFVQEGGHILIVLTL